jgi:hypothetical protein
MQRLSTVGSGVFCAVRVEATYGVNFVWVRQLEASSGRKAVQNWQLKLEIGSWKWVQSTPVQELAAEESTGWSQRSDYDFDVIWSPLYKDVIPEAEERPMLEAATKQRDWKPYSVCDSDLRSSVTTCIKCPISPVLNPKPLLSSFERVTACMYMLRVYVWTDAWMCAALENEQLLLEERPTVSSWIKSVGDKKTGLLYFIFWIEV